MSLTSYHGIIDEPNPSPKQNTIEQFAVRWVTARGRKNGNSRGSVVSARQLAAKVTADGATEVSITRYWIAGFV